MPSPGAGGLSQREDRPNGGSQRRRAQWTGESFKEYSTQRGALAILAQQGFRYRGPRTQMGVVTATNLALCHRCMRGLCTRMVGGELPRRAPPATGVDPKILDLEPDQRVQRLLGVWGEYILHVGGTGIAAFMRPDCGGLYVVEKY